MVKMIVSLMSLMMFTGAAEARYIGPILTKSASSGFVAPGESQSSYCAIYRDKIVLKLSAAGVTSTQERAITLEGEIGIAIEESANGKITKTPGHPDSPIARYTAYKVLPNDAVEEVDLGSKGGPNDTENESFYAQGLKTFLDINCR